MKRLFQALAICFVFLFAGAVFVGCSDAELQYRITTISVHGQVAVGKEKAKAGEEIHIVCEADEGYALKSIRVNGVEVSERNFFMPAADANIVAVFERAYSISVVNHAQGSIVPSTNHAVAGQIVTVAVTANSGYRFTGFFQTTKSEEDEDDVTNVWRSGCNSFVQGEGLTVLSPMFESVSNSYNISVLNSVNGVVEVDFQNATAGSKIAVHCTPNTGFDVKCIKINETEIVGNTFIMPAEDAAVYVEFARVYDISVNGSENGTVTTSKEKAFAGDIIVIVATPAEGYQLAGFEYNGTRYVGTTFIMGSQTAEITPIFEKVS